LTLQFAGKPVIKGTRLAVEFVIDLLVKDWPESEILRNYPDLTHKDIQACLSYATHISTPPFKNKVIFATTE